jgi:large subunit ribosomal protein L18e
MKVREKSEETAKLVEKIHRDSFENKSKAWRAIAEGLNRPRRRRFEVNLMRIEKYAKPKETIVVPGTVLGSGDIKKKVTVAALRFSGNAKEKIEKAGGKCLLIEELFKQNPKGKGLRIMG